MEADSFSSEGSVSDSEPFDSQELCDQLTIILQDFQKMLDCFQEADASEVRVSVQGSSVELLMHRILNGVVLGNKILDELGIVLSYVRLEEISCLLQKIKIQTKSVVDSFELSLQYIVNELSECYEFSEQFLHEEQQENEIYFLKVELKKQLFCLEILEEEINEQDQSQNLLQKDFCDIQERLYNNEDVSVELDRYNREQRLLQEKQYEVNEKIEEIEQNVRAITRKLKLCD